MNIILYEFANLVQTYGISSSSVLNIPQSSVRIVCNMDLSFELYTACVAPNYKCFVLQVCPLVQTGRSLRFSSHTSGVDLRGTDTSHLIMISCENYCMDSRSSE